MIRRLLASTLTVMMLVTVAGVVPVLATELPANLEADYIPGERVGNVLETWTASYNYNHNSLKLECEESAVKDVSFSGSTANGYTLTSNRLLPDPNISYTKNNETGYHEWNGESYSYNNPFSGGYLDNLTWGDISGQKVNMVFEFKVKGVDGKEMPKIGFARTNKSLAGTDATRVEYPVEYNGKTYGYMPSGTSDWESFTGTFASTSQTVNNYEYVLGLAQGTVKGASAIVSGEAYMGKEYLYDIKVTADKLRILAGESVNVDADVVNQVGTTGNYDQNVTWYVLNESRTAAVEGFTVSEGENGQATITASDIVGEGIYYIVAVADINTDFVKGVPIEIGNLELDDYVPEERKGNVLGSTWTAAYNYNHSSLKLVGEENVNGDVKFQNVSADRNYAITANRILPDPQASYTKNDATGYHEWDGVSYSYNAPFSGAYLEGLNWGDTAGKKVNMVFEFKVKGTNSEKMPIIGFGRADNALDRTNSEKVEYPVEYNNKTLGYVPSSTADWEIFSGTFRNAGKSVSNYTYTFGLAQGTPSGACAYISYDAYMGEEYAYDIAIEADATEFANQDSVINIEYGILNQVNRKGEFDQNVEFYVMSTDRNAILSDTGIVVTDNGDGTATVTYDPFDTPVGNYDIVVYSPTYEMARGLTIAVPEREMIKSLELSEFSQNSITATFKLLNNGEEAINAIMIVAMMDDKNIIVDMETERITDVTADDGLMIYTKSVTAGDMSKVAKARVMVFDCGSSEEPSMFNTNMNEIVAGLTKNKQ